MLADRVREIICLLLTTTAVRDKLLKSFFHPPRATTYLNQIHAARKENERKPARTIASRNDVDNDNNRRRNEATSRRLPFLPTRLIYSNHSIDTSL